jgi:hypothetical protein
MINLIREFISFIKRPVQSEPVVLTIKQSIKLIIKGIIIYILFTVVYVIFIALLSLVGVKLPELPTAKMADINRYVILAPLAEELLFRLPLRNFYKHIFVVFGYFIFVILKRWVNYPVAVTLGFASLFLPYVPIAFNKIETKVNNLVQQNYGYTFYLFAIAFGIVHLTNISEFSYQSWKSNLIYIINPFVVGVFFAFVRVKYKNGIFYSIILHALTNLLHFLPSLLSK